MHKKELWYAILVLVLIAALLFWYLSYQKGRINNTEEALGALTETPEIPTETNPVKKVPDLNPTENTNPFKTKNPFE